ncbi:hypothetical protein FQN50_009009 [Emmonsiellopsis sp. PD_5]|nr:hypothetical protein FQN50_009009 [Emmonsiellopsis sp. PD_5]
MVLDLCLPSPAPKTLTHHALPFCLLAAFPAPPPDHIQEGRVKKKKKKAKAQQERKKKAKKVVKEVKVVGERELEGLKASCNSCVSILTPFHKQLHMMQKLANLKAASLTSTEVIKILVAMFIFSVEFYTHLYFPCKLAVTSPAIQKQEIKDLLLELQGEVSEMWEEMGEMMEEMAGLKRKLQACLL